jgi:uncharacterized protein YdaU (DUF1376 family)
MGKDPAFLFYPNDFDAATKFFDDAQVGLYMRLLIAQFQHGHLSERQINFITKERDEMVFTKFKKDEKGHFYNERLDSEIAKRVKYSESRRKNISKRYDSTHVDTHVTTYEDTHVKVMKHHMENENENENRNEISGIGGMGERVDKLNYLQVWEKLKNDSDFIRSLKIRGNCNQVRLEGFCTKFFAKHIGDGKTWPNEFELRKHLGNYVEIVGKAKEVEEDTRIPKTPRREQ